MKIRSISVPISIVFLTFVFNVNACSFIYTCGRVNTEACVSAGTTVESETCGGGGTPSEAACSLTEVCRATFTRDANKGTFNMLGECVTSDKCDVSNEDDCGERYETCCETDPPCYGMCSDSSVGTYVQQPDYCGADGKCHPKGDCLEPGIEVDNFLERTIKAHGYGGPLISLDSMISGISKILYPLAILLGFLFTLIAGYKYMFSEGDPQKVQVAHNDLTAAIVGILFVMLSAGLFRIILNQIIGLDF